MVLRAGCYLLVLVCLSFSFLDGEALKLKEGELKSRMKLKCPFRKSTLKVVWLKDGVEIHSIRKLVVKKSGRVLRIKSIGLNHVGIYSCNDVTDGYPGMELKAYNVSLRRGNGKTKTGKPYFKYPTVMKTYRSLFTPPGFEVVFKCYADGGAHLKYRWYKNGRRLLSRREWLKTDQPVLRLKDAVTTDSGDYTCVVENSKGSINFTFSLVVRERTQTAPRLEKGVVRNQTKYVGGNTSIPCFELATGRTSLFVWLRWKTAPNPKVFDLWLRISGRGRDSILEIIERNQTRLISKETVLKSSTVYGVELVLTNLQPKDEGWYTCFVNNMYGYDYEHMYLKVEADR